MNVGPTREIRRWDLSDEPTGSRILRRWTRANKRNPCRGVRAAEIATIRRQDPERGRTAPERSEILRNRSAVKAAAAGDVKSSFDLGIYVTQPTPMGWVR